MTRELTRAAGTEVRLDAPATDSSPGTLAGYFAVFGVARSVRDWEGEYEETIDRHAFDEAISRGVDSCQVLYHHGFDAAVGSRPLGVPSVLRADTTGVYAEVPLDDTSYNRDLASSLRSGAVRGQSFRARAVESVWSDEDRKVTRTKLDLIEFGPTPFPAYDTTSATLRAVLQDGADAGPELLQRAVEAVLDEQSRALVFPELAAGEPLSEDNRRLVRSAVEGLTALLPQDAPPEAHDLSVVRAALSTLSRRRSAVRVGF